MPIIPIKNLGEVGLIRDMEPHELPPNAWTDVQNVRMREGAVEKFQGEEAAFDPPSIAPYTLFPIRNGSDYFWCYAGATAIHATNGSTHADISRAVGGAYTTDSDIRWTGGAHGNILLLNNGIDVPQMWNPSNLSGPVTALTGWDTNWRARCLRPFKSYLVALDITKSGTRFGTMCKWSDSGSTDAVPNSWDETDPTTDAGESAGVLAETSDLLLDCLPLRDLNVLYKEGSTYGMQFIGGNDIFRFWRIFEQSGMLTRWCMAAFEGRHFVVTQDDVIIHDGQSMQSVADNIIRRLIKSLIDENNYQACCVAPNYQQNEMWFAYPSSGQTWCDKAWVWNWQHKTWYQRNVPTISHMSFGRSDEGLAGTWDEDSATWVADSTRWDEATFDPTARGLLLASFANSKLWRVDKDYQKDGSNYTSYVERKGLTFDSTLALKRVIRVLPYVEGTNGKTITLHVGGHNHPDDTPTYDLSATYTIGTDTWIDCEETQSWRFLALKFSDEDNQKWRMRRYDLDLFSDGER